MILKLCEFHDGKCDFIALTNECRHLKEIGCIYDYAFLMKLAIETYISNGVPSEQLSILTSHLHNVHEIF